MSGGKLNDGKLKAGVYGGHVSLCIMALGEFYEPREALAWVMTPQPLLDGKIPADMLLEPDGLTAVATVIERLRDGVYV